jgi:hypothetical protein
MRLFVEEADRGQWTLLPVCLDDFIDESNPVRVIDVFVDALDLAGMSFEGVEPAATGRPSYHPSVLLKPYIYRRSFDVADWPLRPDIRVRPNLSGGESGRRRKTVGCRTQERTLDVDQASSRFKANVGRMARLDWSYILLLTCLLAIAVGASFCSRYREQAQQLGGALPYESVARTARTTSGPSSLESKTTSDAMPRTVAVAIWMTIICLSPHAQIGG